MYDLHLQVSIIVLCNFLHLFRDIAPRLKLVLKNALTPLESRMTNDSNFKSDLTSDVIEREPRSLIQGKRAKLLDPMKLIQKIPASLK